VPYKFEVYKDRAGQVRVRFRAANGEPMFATEAYTTRASAMKAVASIKKNAPGAAVDDMTKAAAPAKKGAAAKKPAAKKPAARKAAAKKPAARKPAPAKAPGGDMSGGDMSGGGGTPPMPAM
jgi:uncharacterized protein YegP (UPF0339 family)